MRLKWLKAGNGRRLITNQSASVVQAVVSGYNSYKGAFPLYFFSLHFEIVSLFAHDWKEYSLFICLWVLFLVTNGGLYAAIALSGQRMTTLQ